MAARRARGLPSFHPLRGSFSRCLKRRTVSPVSLSRSSLCSSALASSFFARAPSLSSPASPAFSLSLPDAFSPRLVSLPGDSAEFAVSAASSGVSFASSPTACSPFVSGARRLFSCSRLASHRKQEGPPVSRPCVRRHWASSPSRDSFFALSCLCPSLSPAVLSTATALPPRHWSPRAMPLALSSFASFSASSFSGRSSASASSSAAHSYVSSPSSGAEAVALLRRLSLRKSLSSLPAPSGDPRHPSPAPPRLHAETPQLSVLLAQCFSDRHSLQTEAVLSLLHSALLLRVSSSQLLAGLAEELEFRLIRTMSLDNLCAVLSAYSFFFPVSIHLSAGRTAPDPPAPVKRMLALLKKEMERLLNEGSLRDSAARPTENAQDAGPARQAVRRDWGVHTPAAVTKASLVAALAALGRLGVKNGDKLLSALQNELCLLLARERFRDLPGELRAARGKAPAGASGEECQRMQLRETELENERLSGDLPFSSASQAAVCSAPSLSPRSTTGVFSSPFISSSSGPASASPSSVSSASSAGVESDSAVRRRLQDSGTLAAALLTLRVENLPLIRLLVEEVSACLDRLGQTLEATLGQSSSSSSSPSSSSFLPASPLSREEKEESAALGQTEEDVALLCRTVEAVFRLCAECGHPVEPLRSSLWRLERDSCLLEKALAHADLLRLLSALWEEEVSFSLSSPRSRQTKEGGNSGEKEARDTFESLRLSKGPSERTADGSAAAVWRQGGSDFPSASLLFFLRFLPALASARDEAFDTLSPRNLLLLLGSLSISTKHLRTHARSASPPELLGLLNETMGKQRVSLASKVPPASSPQSSLSSPASSSLSSSSPSSSSLSSSSLSSSSRLSSSLCAASSFLGEAGESTTHGGGTALHLVAPELSDAREARFASASQTPFGCSSAERELENGRTQMEKTEELLQELAEALARAATARAIDATAADLLLGLAAVERLECHETGLPFSGASWSPTPSFSFLGDCFLRALLRQWKLGKGRALFRDISQSQHLLRLLEVLDVSEKAGPLREALRQPRSREATRNSQGCLSLGAKPHHESKEAEDEDDAPPEETPKLQSNRDLLADTSAENRRSLRLLDRSSLPFLDDEDFPRSHSTSRLLQREKRPGGRGRRGVSDSPPDDEGEGDSCEETAEWRETLGAARPLQRDMEHEGRVLALLDDSYAAVSARPGRSDCFSSSSSSASSMRQPRSRPQTCHKGRETALDSTLEEDEEAPFSFRSLSSSSLLFADEGVENALPQSAARGDKAKNRPQETLPKRGTETEFQAARGNRGSDGSKGRFPESDGYVRDAQGRLREWWEVSEQARSVHGGKRKRRAGTKAQNRGSDKKGLRAESGRGVLTGTSSKQKYKARRQEDKQAAQAFFLHA
ncbi:hypothetical protein TGFOU_225130 [Toxoplasma gondii FOU]|uniref:Uncharacterized protein n=3 Tax=Toxoplasma gondii TaxID=5811 RepID=A0A086LEL0_TOXGO|nr:hypothetical protein TGFOU_225130 [Toxoplasma gondii FOU]PUA91260.1 hypothetical protein TGBR9_225130 [Toxoplasma gondii TgCATBr9]RQX74619.1 hypothetical protein TGCAST_225130 [Toxoplasma gondii CAST]